MRLVEAQHIDKSLATLGNVVSSLVARSPQIPFRESKLTQLLRDSLTGEGKTLIFCNVNPANYWESLLTLQFLSRVRAVELGKAIPNVEGGDEQQK